MTTAWLISLHGGHSSAYCDHARDPLRVMLDAAVERGFSTYGVSEHCPRLGVEFLYPDEVRLGWTVDTQVEKFDQYTRDIVEIQKEYAGRLHVLKAFETEAVPHDRYIEIMLGYRAKYDFDYMVGSVHHLDGLMLDYDRAMFEQLARARGGVEALALHYYEVVAQMVKALRPEVVAHFDLIRKFAPDEESVSTPAIKKAAFHALDLVKEHGGILDINTAGYRKRLGRPYVAPWLLDAAQQLGIPMCFGDDSHSVADVGAGIEDARQYLLAHGVTAVHRVGSDKAIHLTQG